MSKKAKVYIVLGALFVILALQALWGIHWQTSLAVILLFVVTELILQKLEEDSATKRALKRTGAYLLVFVCYLGFRTIVGYLLNAPMINADAGLIKVGAKLVWYKDLSPFGNLVLEIAFILPGLGVAYGLVKGGKTVRGLIYAASFVLFLAVLWQVKQPEHTAAMKRNFQGTVGLNARHQNNDALTKEAAAVSSYGIAKVSITHFYRHDSEIGSFYEPDDLKGFTIPKGGNVLQAEPNKKGKKFEGRYYVEVILPDENGDLLGEKKAWINPTEFNWVDGGNILSNKFSIVKSEDNKVWTVNFYTDELTTIIDDLKVGTTYTLTGATKGELLWPNIYAPSKLIEVLQGERMTNLKLGSLQMKYKKGGQIVIRFL